MPPPLRSYRLRYRYIDNNIPTSDMIKVLFPDTKTISEIMHYNTESHMFLRADPALYLTLPHKVKQQAAFFEFHYCLLLSPSHWSKTY